MAQNDGGIKRGDRAETGDNEARPNDIDDDATVDITGDASALGGGPGGAEGEADLEELGFGDSGSIDDLTIHDADDPSLGLTGTPDHPSEDWATETGPTRVPEGSPKASTKRP